MVYVYRVYRLVKVVRDETNDSTHDYSDEGTSVQHCLMVFRQISKRYTPEMSRKVLAIATGKKKYLAAEARHERGSHYQSLILKDEGLILLTPTGFINALAGSIPNVAVIIAIAALCVSFWTALKNLLLACM